MKKRLPALLTLLVISTIVIGFGFSSTTHSELTINDQKLGQSTDPFDKMMQVITHQRCMNCHPSDDRPKQGEDQHDHKSGVLRGADNHGVATLRCESCHQAENNNYSGVPGAPHWALAPKTMAWEGLSRVEIAKSILNTKNNGGRSLQETVKHLTEDALVLWAWKPGTDLNGKPREAPPVSKKEFIAAVKAWAATGAQIPEN